MYKHLLVPIDDSELAPQAMATSIALARSLGARITGFIAEPYGGHDSSAAGHAHGVLARFAQLSSAAGVPFADHATQASRIEDAIVDAAQAHGCDVIVMATHGRAGIGRWLHGSCTERVARRCALPMLVLRGAC